ncbi:MAG: hypothetical protein NTW74_17675, partial [Acidobacteria bacterium]|nr:hypothetical protein [Acidobacteriota bacterium]
MHRALISLLASLPLLLAQDGPQLLKENCAPCHGATSLTSAGLSLTSRDLALKGGTRGPAIVPGKAADSKAYRFAAQLEEPHMPPNKPLTEAQLKILKDWIDQGAEWKTEAPINSDEAAAALARLEDRPIKPQERTWWAFQKPIRPKSATSIDGFLRAKWTQKDLKPSG